jgi:tetratricopeptide (TPR) repeat protein
MKRERVDVRETPSPEVLLQRAIAARSADARARYARKGLSCRAPLDRVTQSMLLRQLYLAHFEQQRFAKALEIAQQMLKLGILADVCHQDVARAMVALGDVDGAADHLRLAARVGPARRRAFHLWTLGSILYVHGRFDLAESALRRAVRWGTTDRALYAGHLALVRLSRGQPVPDLPNLIEQLEQAACGQGYGRFVLGMLCVHASRRADAHRYLEAFAKRTRSGRKALELALQGELKLADRHIRDLVLN